MRVPVYYYAPRGFATAAGIWLDSVNYEMGEGFLKMKNGKTQPKTTLQTHVNNAGFILTTEGELKKMITGFNRYKEGLKEKEQQKEVAPILKNEVEKTKEVMSGHNQSIVPATDQDGSQKAIRVETPNKGGEKLAYVLTLNNLAGTEPVKLIIGDGLGLIANEMELPPLPDTFIVGGTWKERGLSVLSAFAKSAPVVLREMVIRTSDREGSMYYTDFFNTAHISLSRSLKLTPMNFSMSQDGSQFNDAFRKVRDFKMMIAQMNGIVLEIPAGESVTINWYIKSVGLGSLQELIQD